MTSDGEAGERAAEERLAAFAGDVSHDLKNPLSAIRMCLELAREELGRDDAEVISLLGRAERGVARMDVMIDDLHEYARAGSTPERVEVPLADVASQVLTDLGEAVAPGQVRGVADLPTVTGDRAQLQLVLRHLVENALHFSAWDSSIELGADRVDEGWRVSVADHGPGVPPDQRVHVFDPLVRLDKTVPGSGIGLATCHRVVVAHGGRMGIDDRVGGGAVVWFELPD